MPRITVEPGSLSHFIWDEKYRYKAPDGAPIDKTIDDTFRRVAKALAAAEPDAKRNAVEEQFFDAMSNFEFLGAGRILAGAGTGRDVTLVNCFVMDTIPDSLEGINRCLAEGSLTMKAGGGIGMDFSTLRPRGAFVKGVESHSSGAVSFMGMWDAMCQTISSAGSRRGAMMGTLRCDHPDIEEFITAKQTAGRLTNFNVSVLVTDAFMEAVKNDTDWHLNFDGKVYKTVRARELWNSILKSTYEYAEPGVIFIDRVNERNPLKNIEDIQCTNPCGEQLLPPYGACVLGSINLAMLVKEPFTKNAALDLMRLKQLCRVAVRYLDNVITVTKYPLEHQRKESEAKRRIGIGVTGVADMLIMLGLRYGSEKSVKFVDQVMADIKSETMKASEALGEEKGDYPLWQKEHGPKRRNSHLMSIAPTGTISCFAGNVSSGIEPVFAYSYTRKIRMPDGSFRTLECADYVEQLRKSMKIEKCDGSIWVSTSDLKPADHIAIAGAAQKHIDSAVSKTINCDAGMTFEDFGEVYSAAYDAGMKGCTTYRPSGVRGAVLEKKEDKKPVAEKPSNVVHLSEPMKRPEELIGKTYKIRSGSDAAVYVTINDAVVNGQQRPFEIFFNTKSVECQAWMTALSRMISGIFRKGGDISFIIEELTSVHDPKGGQWEKGEFVPSTAASVGRVIQRHLSALGMAGSEDVPATDDAEPRKGKVCPKCHSGVLINSSGCWSCNSCTYSKCG